MAQTSGASVVAMAAVAAVLFCGCAAGTPRAWNPAWLDDQDAAQGAQDRPQSRQETIDGRTLSLVESNEPIYAVVGFNERINAKLQFSFRYKLVHPDGSWAQASPTFVDHLYFGYTQTSIWDLESPSAPFLDSSYRPAAFWADESISMWSTDSLTVGLEAGLEHESNGKSGDASRTINIAYVEPSFVWDLGEDTHLMVAPKAWAYLEKSDNSDIDEFRGWGSLRLGLVEESGFGLTADARLGSNANRGALDLIATYPLSRLIPGDLGGYLMVEYFNGWGETIVAYDSKSPAQIRIGFMLVR